MAEWSKALVLGTSLFGGVGSNPAVDIFFKANFHFQEPLTFVLNSIWKPKNVKNVSFHNCLKEKMLLFSFSELSMAIRVLY